MFVYALAAAVHYLMMFRLPWFFVFIDVVAGVPFLSVLLFLCMCCPGVVVVMHLLFYFVVVWVLSYCLAVQLLLFSLYSCDPDVVKTPYP